MAELYEFSMENTNHTKKSIDIGFKTESYVTARGPTVQSTTLKKMIYFNETSMITIPCYLTGVR